MPAIAEMRKAYEEASEQWQARWYAIELAERTYEDLTELVALSEKAALIRLRSRVRHAKYGAGTVEVITGCENYCVHFDSLRGEKRVHLSEIEKLVEGDKHFEPPLPLAIEHKPPPPVPIAMPVDPGARCQT
jgi:hypothetical protein